MVVVRRLVAYVEGGERVAGGLRGSVAGGFYYRWSGGVCGGGGGSRSTWEEVEVEVEVKGNDNLISDAMVDGGAAIPGTYVPYCIDFTGRRASRNM